MPAERRATLSPDSHFSAAGAGADRLEALSHLTGWKRYPT